MIFADLKLTKDKPLYVQINEYVKRLLQEGILQNKQKLPATRELSSLLHVSRNTVIKAYCSLEDEGIIVLQKGIGAFIADSPHVNKVVSPIDWLQKLSPFAILAEDLDIMKHGIMGGKGMISFTSIAPDESFFDISQVKKAFLDRFSLEGERILNYGYAKGYKPLTQYLSTYMESKGTDMRGKDILITNGFTEGFDMVLSALCTPGQKILCENPTHNTAIKLMKLHQLDITGIKVDSDGINLLDLQRELSRNEFSLAYLVPSYHNPTGITTPPAKRLDILSILRKYRVPIIEDGFNEELRYSGSHIAPLIACSGEDNSVIYIGSFSKVLFPGLRIGWIAADKQLINYLESIKRSRSIHTSTLDQAVLYQYLYDGNFEKFFRKAKKIYKEKYETAWSLAMQYIPCKKISGDGGLHIFLELEKTLNARDVLEKCLRKGVVFTPGNIFFTDNTGENTLRLGFSRVDTEDIKKGFKIIGDTARECLDCQK